uniref:Uncharacterized protein n=1 Tax=Arundo donax TaxID=35708 RepID=A0A0A9AYH1_ARUDO
MSIHCASFSFLCEALKNTCMECNLPRQDLQLLFQ